MLVQRDDSIKILPSNRQADVCTSEDSLFTGDHSQQQIKLLFCTISALVEPGVMSAVVTQQKTIHAMPLQNSFIG